MNKKGKIAALVLGLLLLIVAIILIVVLPNRQNAVQDGTTESQDNVVFETENKRENLRFHEVDTLTVTDRANGDTLAIPGLSLRTCETESGGTLFYLSDGLQVIREAVLAIDDPEATYDAFLYADGHALRIEKQKTDGTVNTYAITETTDAEGNTVYDLSDCRAYFTAASGEGCVFKFPYYFLANPSDFSALDYGTFGECFVITVSKAEFLRFYENSALYIIKDGANNDFSLEHTYAAVDSGNAYPVRFVFGTNESGQQTVTVEMGTVSQEVTTQAP